MISEFTWPNFKAGTSKEGTRILIEENGFSDDVKYGKTKIFIRSPNTLFALEKVSYKNRYFFYVTRYSPLTNTQILLKISKEIIKIEERRSIEIKRVYERRKLF